MRRRARRLIGWAGFGFLGLITGALGLPGAALAAQAAKTSTPELPPAASEGDQELDEVLVEGRKPLKNPTMVHDWMARLPGQFVVDGAVVLYGTGGSTASFTVQGRTNCVGYPTPAVQCELRLRWPETKSTDGSKVLGGVSKLNPAVLLYTYEAERVRVRHMLVDSEGIAESAAGFLYDGDTLITRNKCVNVPGHCERVARTTADPDLKQVEMNIDLEVEFQRVVSYRFVLHRVSGTPAGINP